MNDSIRGAKQMKNIKNSNIEVLWPSPDKFAFTELRELSIFLNGERVNYGKAIQRRD